MRATDTTARGALFLLMMRGKAAEGRRHLRTSCEEDPASLWEEIAGSCTRPLESHEEDASAEVQGQEGQYAPQIRLT